MARHKSLPQSMTPERLGEWIDLNKVDIKHHVEKVQYTPEEIQEFEHKSSVASRAIDKLDAVLEYVKGLIKKGTPYDINKDAHTPVNVTVPPTQGTDTLKANREFADQQIDRGYKEEITKLYMICEPETLRMLAVDIEGKEWPEYSRDMTKDEVKQYGKPVLTGDSAKGLDIKPDGHDEKGRKKFKVEKKDDEGDPFGVLDMNI